MASGKGVGASARAGLRIVRGIAGMAALSLVAASIASSSVSAALHAKAAGPFIGQMPTANCGAGSRPEQGVQGEVPLAERQSGDSKLGYRCNLELVGQLTSVGPASAPSPEAGAGWQNAWYGNCDYYDTKTATGATGTPSGTGNGQPYPGTQVVDVSDPAHPVWTANLNTPAMNGAWESLRVNEKRGLLGAVGGFGSDGNGPMYVDIYDISADCAHPVLDASLPLDIPLGHEGNFSPDGTIYYGSSLFTGTVSAIDVTNPTAPTPLGPFWMPDVANLTHGLWLSDDGNTMYNTDFGLGTSGDGLVVEDVSNLQKHLPIPPPPHMAVSSLHWTDGSGAQVGVPFTEGARNYLIFTDELSGGQRILDVTDRTNPFLTAELKLGIQLPSNSSLVTQDTAGNGSFTYSGHYCNPDTEYNATAVACGDFQSGIRVFDIRDVNNPREIAYYNPPAISTIAATGSPALSRANLLGSEHGTTTVDGSTDWCTSLIRFKQAADGTWMLWAQCQDNGFQTLKFTNGAYPLGPLQTIPETPNLLLLPLAGLVGGAVLFMERRHRRQRRARGLA